MKLKLFMFRYFAVFLASHVLGRSRLLIYSEASIIFYHGPSCQNKSEFDYLEFEKIIDHPAYDEKLTTILYVFSHLESPDTYSGAVITQALCSRSSEHNILILNYAKAVSDEYFGALNNAIAVSQ